MGEAVVPEEKMAGAGVARRGRRACGEDGRGQWPKRPSCLWRRRAEDIEASVDGSTEPV